MYSIWNVQQRVATYYWACGTLVWRIQALRKSEEMLEEDSLEFDAFLKKNDEKV